VQEQHADAAVCDVLLDQDLFMGLGNKMKNEAFYRVGVHPLHPVGALFAGGGLR